MHGIGRAGHGRRNYQLPEVHDHIFERFCWGCGCYQRIDRDSAYGDPKHRRAGGVGFDWLAHTGRYWIGDPDSSDRRPELS